MSIPTPSDFARHLTQRKQHEIEREQQIAELEKKLAKSSSEKHDRTVQKNRARFGSGKARESAASHSSRKVKAPATSSKSESMKNHPAGKGRSLKDFKQESITRVSRKDTVSVKSEKQSTSSPTAKKTSSEQPKKPFVRKPHLTQRLSDNEALLELQKSFPKTKHHNRAAKSTRSSSKRK